MPFTVIQRAGTGVRLRSNYGVTSLPLQKTGKREDCPYGWEGHRILCPYTFGLLDF